jgi:hypothetical protein
MVKETIEKGITMGYLRSMLSTPIKELAAFKLGIVDKDGKRLKKPETAEELSAYGPLEEYIISIKQELGPSLGLITKSVDVKLESVISAEEYAKFCETTLNLKEKFKEIGKLYNEAVTYAYHSGLSTSAIEKLIIDSLFE